MNASLQGTQFTWLLVLLGGGLLFMLWLGWGRRRGPLPAMEVFRRCVGGESAPAGEPGAADGPRIRWLGHSSFRLEWAGLVVLLDPVVSARVSIAPRRVAAPDPAWLERVDAVLVTHGHMDHLDNRTLEAVAPCELHLPARSGRFLTRVARQRHRLHEFRIGDSFQLGPICVDVVPARHGGWRYPWQRGYFACGFVFSGPGCVLYFAGDSAWGPHFAEIGRRFRPDTAILPIGGYSPRWFLRSRHINPPEAAEAARALGVSRVIPCHYGTYRVSLEGMQAPIRWFRREITAWQTATGRTSDPSS